MNLSLYRLRKKLKSDKSGQGSLVGIILASVIGTIIVGATTAWYLSMNRNMTGTNDRLEAMTIAMSEWQRLEHMSLDELEDNRENYKTPYNVGDKFKVGITLGEQGFFDEGKCNSLTGDYAKESANCFKDTIMTVYDKDGYALYTTRSLPLSAGSGADNFPEGTILAYTGDLAEIPKGWVLCDGNNGTPDLRGRFLEGTGTNTGLFKSAGLPNITGRFGVFWHGGSVANGAFYKYGYHNWSEINHNQDPVAIYGFDASRSNPIYGSSETVQPPAYTVFYIMKTNTDFHYNHTNPVDTPSFYTKDEIDQMFNNTKNNFENNIDEIKTYVDAIESDMTTNYLDKSSTEYVRNYTTNYTLGLGYNSEDSLIHGYVDDIDKKFSSNGIASSGSYSGGTWVKLTNGMIIVRGKIDMPVYASSITVTLPILFSSKSSYSVALNDQATSFDHIAYVATIYNSNSSFTIFTNKGRPFVTGYQYIAIGT